MVFKYIYLVIHGEISDQVPDSSLTSKGVKQMELLKNDLPEKPSYILSGTGSRHLQSAKMLGLEVNHYSDVIETGAISVKVLDQEYCIFPGGNMIPNEKYLKECNSEKKCLENMISNLPDNSIVVGGLLTVSRLNLSAASPSSILILRVKTPGCQIELAKVILLAF
jgi:hypothetical protein